ncbi:MAG TPA: tetratricopeptide repeat protein [Burkholderiales bacterium]|nr:tetratricopeptide repeat protein [Burkholderiales bacterium]
MTGSGNPSLQDGDAAAAAACDALRAGGKWREAAACYRTLLATRPASIAARLDLALCEDQLGEFDAARANLERIVEAQPAHAIAHYRLGVLDYRAERFAGALEHYRVAMTREPAWHIAAWGVAACFHQLRRYAEALDCYRQALRLKSDDAELWYNYAKALKDGGLLDAALPAYRHSLALDPDNAQARYSLGLLHLMRGDWSAGWEGYELRWRGSDRAAIEHRPQTRLPRWHGEDVAPASGIIVYAEQGLGDAIQCFRYAGLLRRRFARVGFSVHGSLIELFRRSAPPGVEVVARVATQIDESGYTHQISLLSLPAAFATTPGDVPPAPYLSADPARVAHWRKRLAGDARPRIGLVWRGGTLTRTHARDMAFDELRPLLARGDVHWLSLQKDERAPAGAALTDWMPEVGDFDDTAALIEALDRVIAVDTAVAHLAGALGKPVWMLGRFEGEWRWIHGRDTTPWYPSMRIFTQPAPGDWAAVIAAVRARLADNAKGQAMPNSVDLMLNAEQVRALAGRGFHAAEGVRVTESLLFEAPVRVAYGAALAGVRIGAFSCVAAGALLNRVEIGRYCTLGEGVLVAPASPAPGLTSSALAAEPIFPAPFRRSAYPAGGTRQPAPVRIGHDVKVEAGARIAAGVTIGNGAIVGAGAMVTADVPAYAVVEGAPARVVRMRFEPKLIARVEASRWWQYDLSSLDLPFSQPDAALAAIEQAVKSTQLKPYEPGWVNVA